ncbi:NAD(P)H-binding protein [Nocardia sp. NPDC005998]|uniref:NmrA family NAD(P)-binding protein n=1 Tax=Nocardia sp. NPDC005998 TaxID=3156894 RepID=UPI0033BDC904
MMSSTAPDPAALVLVVGATGHLGSEVVDEFLARGKNVRALVRPATGATRSAARGVQIARGDMRDPASLLAAMDGADAVITTAAGYTGSNKNQDRHGQQRQPRHRGVAGRCAPLRAHQHGVSSGVFQPKGMQR